MLLYNLTLSLAISEGLSKCDKPECLKKLAAKKRNHSRRLKYISRSELWSVIKIFPFLKPTLIYEDIVTQVSVDELKKLGIKGVVLDLDNTIMAPKSARLELPVEYWLEVMKRNFKLIVLTNNKKAKYLAAVKEVLDIPVVGFALKPFSLGMKEVHSYLDMPNDKIAIIGDRPLTDIWLGQRYGFKTVLVKALTGHIEPKWKYWLRKLEWSFVARNEEIGVRK